MRLRPSSRLPSVITDTSLRRVLPPERDVSLAIRAAHGAAVSEWVEQNLPDLLRACRSSSAVDVAEADDLLSAYVDEAQGAPKNRKENRPTLAGNSIHADWRLARRFLPRFLSRLDYRLLDVTAFKLEWKRFIRTRNFKKRTGKWSALISRRPLSPWAAVMTPITTWKPR